MKEVIQILTRLYKESPKKMFYFIYCVIVLVLGHNIGIVGDFISDIGKDLEEEAERVGALFNSKV